MIINDFYNVRTQVKALLEGLGYPIYGDYPATETKLPFLVYGQQSKASTGPTTKRISYSVDCYAESFEQALEMESAVVQAMETLRFSPTYESPDSTARIASGLYHKALSFEGRIDTTYNRFL